MRVSSSRASVAVRRRPNPQARTPALREITKYTHLTLEGRVTRVSICLSVVVRESCRGLNRGDPPAFRAETIRTRKSRPSNFTKRTHSIPHPALSRPTGEGELANTSETAGPTHRMTPPVPSEGQGEGFPKLPNEPNVMRCCWFLYISARKHVRTRVTRPSNVLRNEPNQLSRSFHAGRTEVRAPMKITKRTQPYGSQISDPRFEMETPGSSASRRLCVFFYTSVRNQGPKPTESDL